VRAKIAKRGRQSRRLYTKGLEHVALKVSLVLLLHKVDNVLAPATLQLGVGNPAVAYLCSFVRSIAAARRFNLLDWYLTVTTGEYATSSSLLLLLAVSARMSSLDCTRGASSCCKYAFAPRPGAPVVAISAKKKKKNGYQRRGC